MTFTVSGGVQKWALVAYVVLCVYLLAQPSPQKLTERAEALDQRLNTAEMTELSSALAAALQMPVTSVDTFLSEPESKPSSLVFNKLMERCNSQRREQPKKAQQTQDPASIILDSLPMSEALEFFDEVEKHVIENLTKPSPVKSNAPQSLLSANHGQAYGKLRK